MRGRSYTPSPPRGYGRRGRSPSPRGRYRARDLELPTSLLVRNLRHDCRPEDLRRPFGQFGPLKDIYLPRDYHTGSSSLEEFQVILKLTLEREPRGFGFVQFVDPHDADDAKYHMDGHILFGRELTVVFAEENRKKPTDMRARERMSGRYDRRRSSPRRYAGVRSRSRDISPSPRRRHYSRSISPESKLYSREKPHSRYSRERSYSRSPSPLHGSRSRSQSPIKDRSRSRSRTLDPEYQSERSRSPSQ